MALLSEHVAFREVQTLQVFSELTLISHLGNFTDFFGGLHDSDQDKAL